MRRIALLLLALATAGCDRHEGGGRFKGTVSGPLPQDYAISEDASGGQKLSDLGPESLRVLIAPSFGRYAYYIALRRLPAGCIPRDRFKYDGSHDGHGCGPAQIDVRRISQFDKTVTTARFFLPPEESDDLLEKLDARLARWEGDNSGGTDGTEIDIERVRDGKITSMSSNEVPANPDNPAPLLGGDLLRILLAYGPTGFAPRSGWWHVRAPGAYEDVCNENDLATPLNRGFGVGDSDCDAATRWPSKAPLP